MKEEPEKRTDETEADAQPPSNTKLWRGLDEEESEKFGRLD